MPINLYNANESSVKATIAKIDAPETRVCSLSLLFFKKKKNKEDSPIGREDPADDIELSSANAAF